MGVRARDKEMEKERRGEKERKIDEGKEGRGEREKVCETNCD